MPYAGFNLVHTRRNSLVERIEAQGAYEPCTIAAVTAAVAASTTHTFVDIGANIGLISLAVLASVPDARVFAFEPGPHQHGLLAETIRRNRLAGQLTLSALALSDHAGSAPFAVHSRRHAAGDGLLDTRRAGPARSIAVDTKSLDEWWVTSGRPPIDVVKLDTEGSELMILHGATELLGDCRPTLFLEIDERNLEPYPYGPQDVHAFLSARGYELEEIEPTEFAARPQ
jgi:FkbM family methyltransferase